MPIEKTKYNCLGSETFDVLGFKTEEELNKEVLKLMQLRPEFSNNSEINCA